MPDSRFRPLLLALALMMVCAPSIATAVPPPANSSLASRPARPARAGINDYSQRIDANDLRMVVSNIGSFGYDLATGGPGLEFPAGSGKTAMFAGALWLGARVNGETRVAITDYLNEFSPGAMIGASPDDPNNPAYKVYKLRRDDPDSGVLIDYLTGAVPYGAPMVTRLPDGTLDIPGDQMLWSVYNDADPGIYQNFPGGTAPLGVEVQQTTWAYNDPGPLGRTIYMTFRIINKGVNVLDSLRVALWADPDVGGFADDLAGSVWNQPLGYAYNGTNNDLVYGSMPPAVGLSFIEWGRPSTASFAAYGNGTDPTNAEQSFFLMQGCLTNGTPIVDPASGAPFMFAGDPVTGTGSLDVLPQDRRILLSVGAVTMSPGDTVTATWAVVVGQENDRLGSVARLRCDATLIKDFWINRDLNPPPPTRIECDVATAVLISLIGADAGPEGIALSWYATEAVSVAVERRVDDGGWTQVAMRTSDGSGRITYDDRDVAAGHRYGYRLRYRDGSGERVVGETSVDLPFTARTGLVGFIPNPARERPGVAFSLASDHPATLSIHDVAGRRIGSFEVGSFGRGSHLLPLENVSLASGVYLLRLTQDGRTVKARSALVR